MTFRGSKGNVGSRPSGIVLILLSGVVVILLILALGLLLMARGWARGAGARGDLARARLASVSGMDYASARLFREDTYPRFSETPVDRGDDWTSRQGSGASGQGSENPSYSHGEPWMDDGDGAYETGEAFRDRDGDGRFSAFTGRLRAGDLRFSLRVESVGGKVPVNAGGAAASEQAKGLAHLLNNLGAILFDDDGTRPWRKDAATGVPLGAGEEILCSRLGDDLFAARPAGGYASLAEIERALQGMGYAEADRRIILPYLDIGPYAWKIGTVRAPIELAAAPRAVLQALWMYLKGRFLFCPGEPQTFDNVHRRSGPTGLKYVDTGMAATIFPDEAGALAEEADGLRRGRAYSWIALRDRLLDRASAIFARDVGDLDDGFVNPSTPWAQHAWAHGKADIAYYAAALLPPPYPPTPQIVNALPAPSEPRPLALLDPQDGLHRIPYPNLATGDWVPDGHAPFRWGFGTRIVAAGLSLSPPGLFRVASLAEAPGGVSAETVSALRAYVRLDFASQIDYESKGIGVFIEAATGIRVEDPLPSGKRPALLDPLSGRDYPQVATIPFRASSNGSAGGLILAGRECGPLGSQQYWPFPETPSGGTSAASVTTGVSYNVAANGIPHAPSGGGIGSKFQCPGLDGPTFLLGFWPIIDAFSMEAWRMPGTTGDGLSVRHAGNLVLRWDFLTGREVRSGRPGHRVRFFALPYYDTGGGTYPPYPEIFVPDYDAAGNPSTGFHHCVVTVKRYLAVPPSGYRTRVCYYLNGKEWVPGGEDYPLPPDFASMIWEPGKQYFDLKLSDEIRLYDRELSAGEVAAHYAMGRFVPPWKGPSPDPRALPENPVYRSPLYVLDGGTVRWASWTAWSAAALEDKVRMRILLYGLDASGAEIWRQELPAAGPWVPLDLSPAHSFQYVVEFYSPTGAPEPPLLDTPVVGPVSFMVQRPGAALSWRGWESR